VSGAARTVAAAARTDSRRLEEIGGLPCATSCGAKPVGRIDTSVSGIRIATDVRRAVPFTGAAPLQRRRARPSRFRGRSTFRPRNTATLLVSPAVLWGHKPNPWVSHSNAQAAVPPRCPRCSTAGRRHTSAASAALRSCWPIPLATAAPEATAVPAPVATGCTGGLNGATAKSDVGAGLRPECFRKQPPDLELRIR
jgi:hypothetical protein